MLTKCEECGLPVSDKASICPHCGFPVKQDGQIKKSRSYKTKRRRLPNGFGQISEIKNRNLRKPFRAMVPAGKTPTGKPISKPLRPISYFSTYNEAYSALVEYNKNPYDLSRTLTVAELYDRWSVDYFKSLNSVSSIYATKRAWKYCSKIYDMLVVDLRVRHIKGCMETGTYPGTDKAPDVKTQSKIKSIFNLMLDYALEYELVDKNCARSFNLSDDLIQELTTAKKKHIPFLDEEINKLWGNVATIDCADMILIQCYSGWRPQELCELKISEIDLKKWEFVGGMKTEAGRNRLVPIHNRIKTLVLKRYQEAISLGSEYLFNRTFAKSKQSKPFKYCSYRLAFEDVVKKLDLNPEHRPHDGRKHFVTMAKKYKMDEYAIKYIVGHVITDITEKIYTERASDWLRSEMDKIE